MKGLTLNEMPGVVMVLLVTGVLAGTGVYTLVQFQQSQAESAAAVSNITLGLGQNYLLMDNVQGITRIINASRQISGDEQVMKTANSIPGYTLNGRLGQLNVTNTSWSGMSVSVEMTVMSRNAPYNTLSNATSGLFNVSTNLPLIGLVCGVAVVIGVVILAFRQFGIGPGGQR